MWRLVGIQGVYKGRFFDLDKDHVVLGKEEPCGICLGQDEAVADKQAEIVLCNGSYMYRDMDTKCPTVLNGMTLGGMMVLNEGDSIQIGESIFRVENTGASQQASQVNANAIGGPSVLPPNVNAATNAPQMNYLAVPSLVAAILAPIVGLVLGIISLRQINDSRGTQTGQGIATAAIAISGAYMAIVLLILPCIAIPNFIKAREVSRAKLCITNLRQIDAAKGQWSLDNRLDFGSAVGWTDITGPGRYLKSRPVCPSGGTYEVGTVGTAPTCSVSGHML